MSAAKAQNGPNTMYTLLVSHAAKGGGDLAEMMRLSGYNHTPVSQPVSPRRWVEILRAFPSLTWEDLRTAELQMREGMTAADARRIAQEERGGTGMRRLDEVALGTAIRNKRTALGWTQAKLANASGGRTITASYVSNIERFKPQQLTNKRIAALERALGLPDGSLPRIPDGKASKALERVEAAAEVKAPEVLPELPELPETAPTITMTINIGGTVFKIEGPLAGMAGFLAQYQKRVGA